MSALTPELIEKVLALPRDDRVYLAQRLLASLDDPRDPELDRVWAEEIERRIDDLESGKTKAILSQGADK